MKAQIFQHVTKVYGAENADSITESIFQTARLKDEARVDTKRANKWDETDTYVITYADSIQQEGEAPLKTLHQFLNDNLKEEITTVHLLPFYPWSSGRWLFSDRLQSCS